MTTVQIVIVVLAVMAIVCVAFVVAACMNAEDYHDDWNEFHGEEDDDDRD